jgi:hypothetical protein
MDTLYLSPAWDLALDSNGNIAKASVPYALAQDAASAIRTFSGEVFYDTTQGIPYFTQVLGQYPPVNLMRQQFIKAAMTVPGVKAAQVYFSGYANRAFTGQVQITDYDGNITAVGF